MKSVNMKGILSFLKEKGFYIVLLLCLAALGVSGYCIWSGMADGGLAAQGPAEVVVTPAPVVKPVPPAVVTPRPVPRPEHTVPPTPVPRATPVPITASASVFTWPVKGAVLRGHSVETLAYDETMGDWRVHSGLDIAAAPGTPVLACAGGTVSDVSEDDLLGMTVTIQHADGVMSTCANLAGEPNVKLGDLVTTGDVIGSVGDSAIAESGLPSHLHLSMTREGVSVDPMTYLPEK